MPSFQVWTIAVTYAECYKGSKAEDDRNGGLDDQVSLISCLVIPFVVPVLTRSQERSHSIMGNALSLGRALRSVELSIAGMRFVSWAYEMQHDDVRQKTC